MSFKKLLIRIVLVVVLGIVAMVLYESYKLRRVHDSFQSYYEYAGCVKLFAQTETSGICQLPSGQVLEIIEYNNKWYSLSDLPKGAQ